MANIFSGLSKLSDEDVITQIALLKSVTMTNVMKPYGQKVQKGAVKTIKAVAGWFNKTVDINEPEIKEINDVVEEEAAKLKGSSRSQLESLLRYNLRERVGAADCSDDELSVMVIEEAAKHFEIEESLTPAQKADSVSRRFMERILGNAQQEMRKQNSAQAKQMEENLEREFQSMSEEERQQICKALHIDELTGKSMRDTMLKADTPALILGATSGMGAFIATSTILHAIFTTALGITLPFAAYSGAASALGVLTGPIGWSLIFGVGVWQMKSGATKINREMLAQCVWSGVRQYGRPMAPLNEELPSWISEDKVADRDEVQKTDEEMQRLAQEYEEAQSESQRNKLKLQQVQAELEVHKQDLKVSKNKQSSMKSELDILLKQRAELEKKEHELQRRESEFAITEKSKDETIQKVNSQLQQVPAELQRKSEDIKAAEEAMEEASAKEISSQRNLEKLLNHNNFLIKQNEEVVEKLAKSEELLNERKIKIAKRLSDNWEIHFKRFDYDDNFAEDVAAHKHDIRLAVEECMVELHDTEDPRSLAKNRSKMSNGDLHMMVNKVYRLYYRTGNGRVRLIGFHHKNKQETAYRNNKGDAALLL